MTTPTKTAASIYQRLRNHLTDLKLADAADALPAVLDQAQAEGWTLTQALEHLLRVEVTATDGARLQGHRCGDPTGTTVLLVHGYIESVEFWAPVVRRLADAGLDVVLVDQRGHGCSERGTAAFDTDTLAGDLRVTQTVDGNKGVHMMLAKSLL